MKLVAHCFKNNNKINSNKFNKKQNKINNKKE